MQSPEYPELPFVTPAAYGSGRDGRKVMYSVIHYTAGSERSTSAEDGAAYDARRTDGTSCHFFHDQDSTVQCVRTTDRANSAFSKGNRLGIHHELCGNQQSRAQWLDAASLGTLRQAARWVAEDCRKYGLPARRLSVAETRAAWYTANSAGPRGIVGHVDITRAYPEDGGDHEDPGPEFPWDVFLPMVQAHLNGTIPTGVGEMGQQILVADASGAVWLADGLTRVRVTDVVGAGNTQAHQAGLLGNLGNNGQVASFGTAPAGMDAWGVDVAGRLAAIEAHIAAAEAADAARDAAVKAVVDTIASAGGSADTAAIVAAVNAAAAGVKADVKARFAAGGAVA
jgi:hypothetical protein